MLAIVYHKHYLWLFTDGDVPSNRATNFWQQVGEQTIISSLIKRRLL